jgi:hypothetical protein
MRWIQRINEDGTSRFDEVGTRPNGNHSASIQGDIVSFVSPVDGSVVSDRAQLREHNKRNNVVNCSEFDGAEQNKRREERERLYTGEHTPIEKLARKQEIYETMMRQERKG